MDVMKTFLTLSDFVTPCQWLLILKDCLRARLLRFTTTDARMTGLLTLREQLDLPVFNGFTWWLTLFTIWTFRLRTLQELIDLLLFNGLTCWLTLLTLLILLLLIIVEQTGLLIVWFNKFTNTTYITGIWFTDITRTYSLTRLALIQTFYNFTNIRRNSDTFSSDMVTRVSRFRDRSTNSVQWRKIILLKEKRNSSWSGLFRNITI